MDGGFLTLWKTVEYCEMNILFFNFKKSALLLRMPFSNLHPFEFAETL